MQDGEQSRIRISKNAIKAVLDRFLTTMQRESMLSLEEQEYQSTSFLLLPIEIRLKILAMSIGEHAYHVAASGSSECSCTALNSGNDKVCQGCYNTNSQYRLPGLTATCRQLFAEANPLLYRHTVLIFSSTKDLYEFSNRVATALTHVQRVHISCGSAKHTLTSEKLQHRRAFIALRQRALSLSELRIHLMPYYNIDSDRQLLSSFWYHTLCKIHGLSVFSLYISLEMKGPGNARFATAASKTKIYDRVQHTNSVLREWTTISSRKTSTKNTVARLRREIMIEGQEMARRGCSGANKPFLTASHDNQ